MKLPDISLTAAARRLTSSPKAKTPKGAKKSPATVDPDTGWQARAWRMYDLVGEYQTLVTKVATRTSRARLYVAVEGPDGEMVEVKPDEDPVAAALLGPFGRTRGGRSQLIRRMAANQYVAGECWIVGVPADARTTDDDTTTALWPTPALADDTTTTTDPAVLPGEDPDNYTWHVLSVQEVRHADDGIVTLHLPDGARTYRLDDIWVVRAHEPHPVMFEAADSPTRSGLPILEELVGLTMHVSAQVDSRLAGAGVLFVPQDITEAMRAQAGLTEEDDADPFADSLLDAMTTPIADRASASAVVPLVVTKPKDADNPVYMTFSTPLDKEARALREEALQRLAHSQDAPPELLLGTGSMNHWGAWLSTEETIESHIEPRLEAICHALTEQYLWPMAEAKGIPDARRLVVWYDVAHLYAKPNRSGEAVTLYRAGAISAATLREVHGFNDADAPLVTGEQSDPDVEQAFKMLAEAPTLIQNPGLGSVIEQIKAARTGDDVPAPPAGGDAPATAAPADDAGGDMLPAPPEGGDRP